MWDSIRQSLANWLSNTALGQTLGLDTVFLAEYMWLIPLVPIFLIYIYRKFIKVDRPGARFDEFAGTAVIVTVMAIIGFVMLIIADLMGWVPDEESKAIKERGYTCSETDDFNNRRISTEGLRVVLCPGKRPVIIFSNKRLGMQFDPQFENEYRQYLGGNQNLGKYARILPPMSYRGSIATSWKLVPQTGIFSLKEAGLDHVVIRVFSE